MRAILCALSAASLVLTGCGGGGKSTSNPPAGSGTKIAVTEANFSISLPSMQLTAGTYTFEVKNNGPSTHALEIEGPGLEDRSTSHIDPGSSSSLTVTLKAGTYELYCPIDGHKGMGMDLHITVS